ncbi:helix-turn-helix domain-containing protein [Nonomuraea wenchangensis]
MDRSRELADFLRSRRARITPDRTGLPADGRARRVPGLRRDEVARLAGVSTEYYTRLEQGRAGNPSPEVVEALARALELDLAEREHLTDLLARPARRAPVSPQRPAGAPPDVAYARPRARVRRRAAYGHPGRQPLGPDRSDGLRRPARSAA